MKNCYVFTLICAFVLSVPAYSQQATQKLSPVTRMYLQDLEKAIQHDALPQGYVYKKHSDGSIYVSGLMKVDNAKVVQDKLNVIGAIVGTKAGNIWTVQVPYEKVPEFVKINGINYIQLDEPIKPMLDVARKTTRVDSVHAGINMPYSFSGLGVVVGVMDFGFDYTHPTFFDSGFVNYRIKKVWAMNGTGTPPSGYTYGRELVGESVIQAAGTDNNLQTHGTATAGMAAGTGFGGDVTNKKLRGMAYKADIVMVGVRRDSIGGQWMQSGFSDFVDGIKYIFDYAASVNRPAVVNISWGSQSGPHDGTSLMNQACDNLTGAGKIIVMSAGNEGQERIHIAKAFTPTDSLVSTFPVFTSGSYKRTWVDIWGEASKTFCAKVTMFKNGASTTTTGYVCLDNNIHDLYLLGANGLDTCYTQFITSSADFNGKPRLTINIFNKAADSFYVTVKGTDGTIHMWDEYYYYGYDHGYASLFESGNQPWAISGNTITTVSDMGAAQSVLLVGAYTSKISFKNIFGSSYAVTGTVNDIAYFSSRGPMVDGRIKPDIAAPGLTVATAMSSYDLAYTPTGLNKIQLVAAYTNTANGRSYYYGEFSGTSASSPAAAGIVALMLEANPRLTPVQLKNIIFQTAIKDNYTGNLPVGGDNTWGNGKINAYGAVKMALQQNSIYTFNGKVLDCVLFPNPNNGNFTLDYTGNKAEALNVQVTSITGAVAQAFTWQVSNGSNQRQLDCSGLAKGTYVVSIKGTDGSVNIKTVIK